jgi:hypothetical protein
MRRVIVGGMVRKGDKYEGSKDDHATRKGKRKKHGRTTSGRGMFGRKD